ncbi:MAG: low affinity iron permease family protein [Rhodospirillales bacterium]|jgi:low affinity Fe/Cu permease|nr:low affinity iron permease family protein [Rhodospirillales bacterium]
MIMTNSHNSSWFNHFASKVAHLSGHPAAFCTAAMIVILWAISGPFMGFSEVWQLTINTGTTIITFLMVFIIQSTQNRDTTSIQIKLDELIRATESARNSTLNLEELSEEELEKLRQRYVALAEQTSEEIEDAKEEKAAADKTRQEKAQGTR